MQPNFFIYLPLVFLALLFSVFIANKVVKIENTTVSYPEIEGIRGYLAFFVFLHHSYIWYFFLRTKLWEAPKSNMFNHFGQTSVAFFFIITAFLFTNKLLNNKNIDWTNYLKSRFYRLFPAYIFSILLVFLIVIYLSKNQLNDSIFSIFKDCLSWIFFTVDGPKNINSIENTYLLNAGVAWSLPYEWMFYFLIPIIGLFLHIKVSTKNIFIFIVLFITTALLNHASLKQFFPFISGIIVALLLQKKKERYTILKKRFYSLIAILLLLFSTNFFSSGTNILALIISTIVFLIVVSGNSLFGILITSFSNKLGQVTYSLYLLHGIVLFVTFKFIIGFEVASKFSDLLHWIVISISVIPILFLSQLSYKYIELPIMKYSKKRNDERHKPRNT